MEKIRFTMDSTSMTEEGNKMKEIFIKAMVNECIITEEQANKMNDYCFVIAEKGFFGKIFDKLLWNNNNDDSVIINVVKVLK